MKKLLLISTLCILFSVCLCHAARPDSTAVYERMIEQEIVHDSLKYFLDNYPSFGIYRDNYFITGVPLDRKIDKYSADAKFQISIRQILFRRILPRNVLLALTYTQKSFWDIYQDSFPFADNNYNPGIMAFRPITRNGELKGLASFGFEHESNGRDSIYSRSWNYFVISASYKVHPNVTMQVKLWPGFAGSGNKDIYDYRGWGMVSATYGSKNDRLFVSAVVTPRKNWGFNTTIEGSVKFVRHANQFIFLQWNQGYGEGMMNYNKYRSMVRLGLCIKPRSDQVLHTY